MLNKIKIMEVSRELLSIVYKGKEKKYYQLEFIRLVAYKELGKRKA